MTVGHSMTVVSWP